MKFKNLPKIDLIFLFIVIIIALFLRIYFYQPFPLKGDSAEYVYCAINKILPHGPYIIYIWISAILVRIFDPLHSMVLLSLILTLLNGILYFIIVRKHTSRAVTLISTTIIFFCPISIWIGAYQEVSPLQLFFLLLSFLLLHNKKVLFLFLAGVSFGLAFTTHQTSLFTAPAFIYFIKKRYSLKLGLSVFYGFIFISSVVIFWIFYKIIQLNMTTYTGNPLFTDFLNFFSSSNIGSNSNFQKINLLTINSQIYYYMQTHSYFLGVPVVLCSLSGIILSFFQNKKLFILGLLYSFPFIIFEFPRDVYFDGGLYYVLVAPAYAFFAALFLTEAFKKIREFDPVNIRLKKFNITIFQILFVVITTVWIVFSPNFLYNLNRTAMKNEAIMIKQVYNDLKEPGRSLAIFLPDIGEYPELYGGQGGGGQIIEYASGCLPIYKKITKNNFKSFVIYNSNISGWKFNQCLIPITDSRLSALINNGYLVYSFEKYFFENSNLSNAHYNFVPVAVLTLANNKDVTIYKLEIK